MTYVCPQQHKQDTLGCPQQTAARLAPGGPPTASQGEAKEETENKATFPPGGGGNTKSGWSSSHRGQCRRSVRSSATPQVPASTTRRDQLETGTEKPDLKRTALNVLSHSYSGTGFRIFLLVLIPLVLSSLNHALKNIGILSTVPPMQACAVTSRNHFRL